MMLAGERYEMKFDQGGKEIKMPGFLLEHIDSLGRRVEGNGGRGNGMRQMK